MTDICFVCLKNRNNLIAVLENGICHQETLEKLENCVPEIKWNFHFKICNVCKKELYKLYAFKQLCIKNTKEAKVAEVAKHEDVCSDEDTTELGVDLEFSEDEEKPNQEHKYEHFQCFECGDIFYSKSILEGHIKEKHRHDKQVVNYPCEFCKKTYRTRNGVQKHSKVCKERTNVVTKVEKRTESRTKIEDVDLKVAPTCSTCGTTFCNKYLLKRHLQNVHATEKKFKCDTCERTFASAVYLNAHKRYHAGDRSHICSFCGKGFITASDLYHHEKIHANKRAYRCEICPKAFNTSSDLHKHKMCVHLDRSKWKYVCSYCQRRFPLKTNLDTHIKTHTGEKNYSCHLCDRKCINKSVLMRHIETHSNVVAFKCNLCVQGYKYRKSLDIHLAKIHGIGQVNVPEKIKKFFCHLCPKAYFANNKLQKHLRTHSGERPFECPSCEKTFGDRSYVKRHMKIAHNFVNMEKFEF